MSESIRQAKIFMHGRLAGILYELEFNREYSFVYSDVYDGIPISLTMPTSQKVYEFSEFPAYLDGLLPEGVMLEALLTQLKIDRQDYFAQLMAVGAELIGAVTVEEVS